MRVLVTGAGGMLGTAVCGVFGDSHDVIATDLVAAGRTVHLDVRDLGSVRQALTAALPDVVLHLAAETNVDRCEQDPDHAYQSNALGTEHVAWACREHAVPLVYVSTAAVFDGRKPEPYIEYDTPDPVNVYGRAKLAGERVVQTVMDTYTIVRASWMVGGWEIDKKFVYKMVQLARSEKELRVVNDKRGCLTFTTDFARNLLRLLEARRFGLYHMANKGTCTRYQVAEAIVSALGLEANVKVVPVSSDEFPLPAPRPDSEMLRNFKLDCAGLNSMPDWLSSLKTYLRTQGNP